MNIMLDLETLGTACNAAMVSIGAVVFDPDTGILSDEFYRVIDADDAQKMAMRLYSYRARGNSGTNLT